MREGRDPHALSVHVRAVRAGQIVQHEEPALEDDLGVMPGNLRVAEDDVVAGIAADGERTMGLEAVTPFRSVKADEEQFGHWRPILAELTVPRLLRSARAAG